MRPFRLGVSFQPDDCTDQGRDRVLQMLDRIVFLDGCGDVVHQLAAGGKFVGQLDPAEIAERYKVWKPTVVAVEA
jgi:hypothetical protein